MREVRRVAMLSLHTSPLARAGGGDAGGMNVYVRELARALVRQGTAVDVFTRSTRDLPDRAEIEPGVTVLAVPCGSTAVALRSPADLAASLPDFVDGVLTRSDPQGYDVVHGHYWLSGLAGVELARRWSVPLVQSMHTLARVSSRSESAAAPSAPVAQRVSAERSIARGASRLIANTAHEARDLRTLYDAPSAHVVTVHPGVDLANFMPPDGFAEGRAEASVRRDRAAVGLPPDAATLLFAGRIQPMKGPGLAVRTVADAVRADPALRDRLRLAVLGAPSGVGLADPGALQDLAAALGIADLVRFEEPVGHSDLAQWFHAADLTLVPSRAESFGLVALESQACGTPVVASDVGGLRTVVRDGETGVLVPGRDPARWSAVVRALLADPRRRGAMARAAAPHARTFTWDDTALRSRAVYAEARADRGACHEAVG